MPQIREIGADDVDDFDFPLEPERPRTDQMPMASSSQTPFDMNGFPGLLAGMMGAGAGMGQYPKPEVDDSRWKKWETIYPRHLDCKAPFKSGGRRVNLEHSLRWPLAHHIYEVCTQLGFQCQLESHKTHPADWQNPGRVKVQIKKDGVPVNKTLSNKAKLLNKIGSLLRPLESRRLNLPIVTSKKSVRSKMLPNISLRLPYNSPAISHGFLSMAETEAENNNKNQDSEEKQIGQDPSNDKNSNSNNKKKGLNQTNSNTETNKKSNAASSKSKKKKGKK